jgi:hypothetical protein
MPDALIREFQRRDRDQATALANAHLVAASGSPRHPW